MPRRQSRRVAGRLTFLRPALFFFFLVAVLVAPLAAPYSPEAVDFSRLLQPPNSNHLMGTDFLGRDVFSRVLWGGRVSIGLAVSGVILTLSLGTLMGAAAGFWRGPLDISISRILEIWLAIPGLLLLLCVVTILGPGAWTTILGLGLAGTPRLARMVRGMVLGLRSEPFVLVARSLGASDIWILSRHILPNLSHLLSVYAGLQMSVYLFSAAGLSFFGLGIQPPAAEWGAMLNEGRTYFREAWWLLAAPSAALFASSLFINLAASEYRSPIDERIQGSLAQGKD